MNCIRCEKDTGSEVNICPDCVIEVNKLIDAEVKQNKLAEAVGKTAFAAMKGLCRAVQGCQPVVKSAGEGFKKAWKEAKENK